jgi:hypothetical protein
VNSPGVESLESQVLSQGQRGIVFGEQALHPAADQRGDARQDGGRLLVWVGSGGRWHLWRKLSLLNY